MKRAYQEWPTMHTVGNGTLRNFTPAVCEGWQPEGSQGTGGQTTNRKTDGDETLSTNSKLTAISNTKETNYSAKPELEK